MTTTNATPTPTDTAVSNSRTRSPREALRDKALNMKPRSIQVEFCGEKVEVRQPSLAAILSFQSAHRDEFEGGVAVSTEGANVHTACEMIVRYTYYPGTNEKLFEDGDIEIIANLPFNDDIQRLQEAIGELTSYEEDVSKTVKN